MEKKKVIVIGAGPAGLMTAYELLKQKEDFDITILEESRRYWWNIQNSKI